MITPNALVCCLAAFLLFSNALSCGPSKSRAGGSAIRSATVSWYGLDDDLGRWVPVRTTELNDAVQAKRLVEFLEDFDRRIGRVTAGKWAVEIEMVFQFEDGSVRQIAVGNDASLWRESAEGPGDRPVRPGLSNFLQQLVGGN